MLSFDTPHGMSRRHFMSHLAGASAMAMPAFSLTQALQAAKPRSPSDHLTMDGWRSIHHRPLGP